MNRSIKLIVIVIICSSIFYGCDNDDFAAYTNIDYDVDTHINSNVYVISEVRKELTQIVELKPL